MLSVCLSVCDVGGLWSQGWNSSEIISRLVSLGCSLSADPNIRVVGGSAMAPSLFRIVPSLTTYDLPFTPKWGFPMPPRYANCHISATDDPINFMFGSRVGFSGSADRMSLFQVTSNPSWRQAAILDYFEWPYLRNGSFDPLVLRASRGHVCDSKAFLLILTLASWTQVPWKFHGRINSTQLVLRL